MSVFDDSDFSVFTGPEADLNGDGDVDVAEYLNDAEDFDCIFGNDDADENDEDENEDDENEDEDIDAFIDPDTDPDVDDFD